MELVGFLFIFNDRDSFSGLDFSHESFADEVLDFDGLLIGSHKQVDGEMVSGTSHFEFETFGHTSDHISDMRINGGNSALLLSSSEPH